MKELMPDERKALLLEILKEFHKICEDNNLIYYLSGGSLLGAIRHRGFIPWDDDVDVWMPMEDITKLCKLKFNDYYYWDCEKDKNYPISFGRFQKNGTLVEEGVRSFDSIKLGINIDIFPLYECNRNNIKHIYRKYRKLSRNYKYKSYTSIKGENKLKNLVKEILHTLAYFVDFNKNANKIRELLKKCSTENNNCVCSYDEYENFIFDKKLFSGRIKRKFENLELYIPNGYHEILTTTYGDYMIPSQNTNSKHRTKSYII